MNERFSKNQLALAVAAAIGTLAVAATPTIATAAKTAGQYVAGDIHNHTTCSDGSISMQRLVNRSTDRTPDSPWGLDWFVQAGHGGNGNRNCTLVEDATLATPAYPFIAGQSPNTTWVNSGVTIKGDVSGSGVNRNMWRWQSLQEFQYQLMEYENALKSKPLFLGLESVVAGHEHSDASIIAGQIPLELDNATLPSTPGYTALGNANALAMWEYCFDRGDSDLSRGNASPQPSTNGNNWNCTVPFTLNEADPSWSTLGQKLNPTGLSVGAKGHNKTVAAIQWMYLNYPQQSWYIPTHLERAGPFNYAGNNGFNVEHLRNFNNTGPTVAFGFETQPGHGASNQRGEYTVRRNSGFPGEGSNAVDSVGGTTYGGTGVYGAQIGGVWDALLGEGRNFWFLASSDWHARGTFGADDRRSSGDFYPGEYQRMYVMTRNGADKIRPQMVLDGMRSGNIWTSSGQIIDRLAFVACASYPGLGARTQAQVEGFAVNAANGNTDTDVANCATMGEKLKVRANADIIVAVVVRDPAGTNYSPYTFPNPSLLQVSMNQPINAPVLDHVDVIRGMVSGYKFPQNADYYGEWPRNFNWLHADGTTADLSVVPDAAKNTSAALLKTWSGAGSSTWTSFTGADGTAYLKMSFKIPAVQASQYVRLRGTNLPPATPWETDASGNPLADLYTNSSDTTKLRIPCTTNGTNVPASGVVYTGFNIDGCPLHMPTATGGTGNPINGQRAVALDVAAWSDLWFYSNPIYVEVAGSTPIWGVQ